MYLLRIQLFLLLIASSISAQLDNFVKYPHTQPDNIYEYSVLLETVNSNLLLFYLESDSIKFAQSEGNEVIWTPPVTIKDGIQFYNEYFDLNAIVTSSGRIIIIYKSGGSSNYYHLYSDDDGTTWSTQQILPTGTQIINKRLAKWLGLTSAANNEIWCTYQRQTSIYSIKSSDDGITWSDEIFVSDLINDQPNSYPNIHSTNTGQLLLTYLENESGRNLLYSKISSDSGQTWSSKNLLSNYGEDFISLSSAANNSGHFTLAIQTILNLPIPNFQQSDIIYLQSNDGINWTAPTKLTNNLNFDGDHYLSSLESRTLISYSSVRYNENKEIWYGEIGLSEEDTNPPIITSFEHSRLDDHSFIFTAGVLDDESISQVQLNYLLNDTASLSVIMNDDGNNGDLISGDFIYTGIINELSNLDKILYSVFVTDNDGNSIESDSVQLVNFIEPEESSLVIDINNIKLPIDNRGIIGDVEINGISHGGRYDDYVFLFSGGFTLSGLNSSLVWSNGNYTASRIVDYQPGGIGTDPKSPLNLVYTVTSSDPPFGSSWDAWVKAVERGAKFYDGNNDGIYNPIDLNSNGIWDPNEDRPDFQGDMSAWCVYNDGVDRSVRRYTVDPQGIEIKQSVFASGGNGNEFNDIIFIRYEIENKGTVSEIFDSVYFAPTVDPDLGDYFDDLVGCDTLENSSYVYNDGNDDFYGINPPAFFIKQLQGPPIYIPDITFIDNNGDGDFTPGIDTPLDSAAVKRGKYLGEDFIPGAKNLLPSAFTHFMGSHSTHGDPSTQIELRRYLIGGMAKNGAPLDPCTWNFGNGSSLSNCNTLDPNFMYSGDPVTNDGWLNSNSQDAQFLFSTGPFNLNAGEPVELIYAYIVGRGTDHLNSITVAREISQFAQAVYDNNFEDLPTSIDDGKNLIANEFQLYQNYPNPFNPVTTIKYTIPVVETRHASSLQKITLKIYDILGREITTLVNEQKSAGIYELQFDASSLSSGVYFYQLSAGSFTETKKLMLIK